MIFFKYKSLVKQIKIKSKKNLEERMAPWLQEQFNIRNPIVGFKAANKYYDVYTFFSRAEKFYGQQVQIIQANDQLEVSFVSENLNSSSFIRPNQPNSEQRGPPSEEIRRELEGEEEGNIIQDLKLFEKKLKNNKTFNILFSIHQLYRKQVIEIINEIKPKVKPKINMFFRLINNKFKNPTYTIYIGNLKVAQLNLTKQIKTTLKMCIEKFSTSNIKFGQERQILKDKELQQQQMFKTSYEQQNQAPSFTTYQLQQRLNQDACLDYLTRMVQEKLLKKYEYTKLCERCEDNFVEFYRIFCEGVIDNDYQSFKNQILLKLENNLEILLRNVDEMDESRPISRQEQRRQNLKKSVPKIQIVKVENYFEILDQLQPFLNYETMAEIKSELLDEADDIFNCFSDFLSRKTSREELAIQLERIVNDKKKRPVSRCLPRSANRSKSNNFDAEINISPIPERAQQIKLMGQKPEPKEIPPMFGSSKNNGNFSPIKYMSDIESNYKQAWARLENKASYFQPQEYGLLYHYLQTRDDSISNHIQQLEWNEQTSIDKLKDFLTQRIKEIMAENFNERELELIKNLRSSPQIDCIYENFKYESDLNTFLAGLKDEIAHHKTQLQSINKVLIKKSSDSQLLKLRQKHNKHGGRRYSDEADNLESPKGSSFSHPRTSQSVQHLEVFQNLWVQQFEEMLQYCSFTEQHKQFYLREAFKEGNPSVYLWIHNYCQNQLGRIDPTQMKKNARIRQSENKLLCRMLPIYNQILKSLVDEGVITDKVRKWHIAQFVDFNLCVIAIFEHYSRLKNKEELIENLNLVYELSNKEMEYYRTYLKRIEDLLKDICVEDEISVDIFNYYPEKIKAISQLYFLNGNVEDLLENLHIIHGIENNRRKITCSTLNFSGINLNPFEYHDGSEQITGINEIMTKIYEKQSQFFKGKNLSVIDKKFSHNRMSARYGTEMVKDGRLPNKQQYLKLWMEYYKLNRPSSIKDDTEQIQEAYSHFDYYIYISIVSYLFKKELNSEYEIENIHQLNGEKLVEFLKQKHSRPASSVTDKEQLVMDYLFKSNIDVLFLQEAGEVNWGQELVRDYIWTKHNNDSAIIFKKDKIGHAKMSLQEKYKEELNFNKDSAMFFSQRGYLLVSAHLTSKSHNVDQAEQMFEVLRKIKQEHPMLKIIIGMDANHYLAETEKNFLNTVPDDPKIVTSTKQRTHLQCQFHKAQKLTSSVKDQILSTLPIKESQVIMVNEEKPKEGQMLPNNTHPYDHFIVTATI